MQECRRESVHSKYCKLQEPVFTYRLAATIQHFLFSIKHPEAQTECEKYKLTLSGQEFEMTAKKKLNFYKEGKNI